MTTHNKAAIWFIGALLWIVITPYYYISIIPIIIGLWILHLKENKSE